MWSPRYTGLRVPARFFMFTALCLSVAAGVSLSHILRRARWRAPIVAIVLAGLWIDGAIARMPLSVPPGDLDVHERGAIVIELPFGDAPVSVLAMYQSMAHRLPVVNGFAGYITSHADVIQWGLNRRDPSILTELGRGRPLYVVIASSDQADRWTAFMAAQHGAELIGVSGGGRVYRMGPAPFGGQLRAGAALAATASIDDPWLMADLGSVQTVRMVELRTHGNLVRLPAAIQIESSEDGREWTRQVEQAPGAPALIGALASPRVVPLQIFVPDARARFVRINATRFGPRAVTVYGP